MADSSPLLRSGGKIIHKATSYRSICDIPRLISSLPTSIFTRHRLLAVVSLAPLVPLIPLLPLLPLLTRRFTRLIRLLRMPRFRVNIRQLLLRLIPFVYLPPWMLLSHFQGYEGVPLRMTWSCYRLALMPRWSSWQMYMFWGPPFIIVFWQERTWAWVAGRGRMDLQVYAVQ